MLLDLFSVEYGQSSTDTHDFAWDIDGYKKSLKKHQKALEKREEEKLVYAEDLRRQIRDIINPPVVIVEKIDANIIIDEVFADAAISAKEQINLNDLLAKLAFAEREIRAFEEQRRRLQDEDDMAIILMAMTIH